MKFAYLAFHAAFIPMTVGVALPAEPVPLRSDAAPETQCFVRTLRAIQNAIRWPRKSGRTKDGRHLVEIPAWSQDEAEHIGGAFIQAGHRHGFRPGFLAAFAVNESDLKESSVRETLTTDGRKAKDSGLMAVRCIVGNEKRWWKEGHLLQRKEQGARFVQACLNDPVRGMTPSELLEPDTNIEIAANILARLRDEGVPLLVNRVEKVHGRPKRVREVQRCPHKGHPFYAHYNWGARTIETGPSRHYPHRVAVLYHAISEAMDTDAPELADIQFVHDKGSKVRRVDRPVGERQRRLFTLIQSCEGQCGRFALR